MGGRGRRKLEIKQERIQPGWEDCLKIDIIKVNEEEKWRENEDDHS